MNDIPKYQNTTLTVVPLGISERRSTSLKVDPDIYTEFAIVARRRQMENSDLLDYAVGLVIEKEKAKEKTIECARDKSGSSKKRLN